MAAASFDSHEHIGFGHHPAVRPRHRPGALRVYGFSDGVRRRVSCRNSRQGLDQATSILGVTALEVKRHAHNVYLSDHLIQIYRATSAKFCLSMTRRVYKASP